jgi:hypothetical protein
LTTFLRQHDRALSTTTMIISVAQRKRLWCDLAAFLAPEPDQLGFIRADDNPRIRTADEGAPFDSRHDNLPSRRHCADGHLWRVGALRQTGDAQVQARWLYLGRPPPHLQDADAACRYVSLGDGPFPNCQPGRPIHLREAGPGKNPLCLPASKRRIGRHDQLQTGRNQTPKTRPAKIRFGFKKVVGIVPFASTV